MIKVHKFQDKNQWSYGLLCDTSIMFFHNSFLYSHLISRVRFHMAERTSKQQSINLRRIGNWTRIGFGKYILRPNSPAFKWKTKNLAEITISNVWFQICLWVLLYCIFYFSFFSSLYNAVFNTKYQFKYFFRSMSSCIQSLSIWQ